MNTIKQNLLNRELCSKCRKYQSLFKDLENNTNYCNCLKIKDEMDDEINDIQVNKKEIEEEKEKEEKNVDSKAKGEEEDEENLEISEIFKIDETKEEMKDETKEEMKDITRKEINDEKDKSINNVKQRKHLNDENYENEMKMLEREIESNEEEEEEEELEEEELEEKEEEEEEELKEKEEILSGKNNLTKLLKNVNQYVNKNDILNGTNDKEKYKETSYLNCPQCNRILPCRGKGYTICLKTCQHILCRYCISILLQKFIHNEIVELRCPYIEVTKCNALIDEAKDNIEKLVNPNLYKKYLMSLAKELKDNVKSTVVYCITLNCKGWCVIEGDSVDNFLCPICKRNNYINLKANKNEISEDTYENEYIQNERYNELMLLMANDFVPNFEPFECPICLVPYKSQEGLVLKNCLHTFCKTCLANTVLFSDDADVKCPYKDENYSCEGTIQQSEIKAIVKSEDFNKYLRRSIVQAESAAGNSAYHCKTPDCPGWCIYEPYVESFICPVCEKNNCLLCKKIHKVNCTEDMLPAESSDSKSDLLIQLMLNNKNALPCPTCNTIIMKIDGCDAVVCTICKTEICWLTRGPRWGPKGRGDISGGCRCKVNGKCHPNCRNCH